MRILPEQIKINDVLYCVGSRYDYTKEVKKVVVSKIELTNHHLIINNNYYLYKINDSFENESLFFSEKKANNVLNNFIEISNKAKEKYKKQDIKKEEYKQYIIDEKLEEKYINKPIMIYQENQWKKTVVIEIYADYRGIYLIPKISGHTCKLSREGLTWKWWSELEELETQKRLLEEKINKLKEGNNG